MRIFKSASLILVLIIAGSMAGLTVLGLQTAKQRTGQEKEPITTDGGKAGVLLKQWWKEGTAAGNVGDFYDNRDGDHSPLDIKRYPQITAIKYSPEEIKLKKHWAIAQVIVPHVTFGNSSTAAPAHQNGSNPRNYYVSPVALSFLYTQYIKNNLYIYPEHRDHHPGHNGVYFPASGTREEGYGDLYPTNTPYLIISQGSSTSDQPFMRMMAFTLAAFRPDVKKKLTETGLLMPTIQMLMRTTNTHLKEPKEYLTGKAHPSVFEGSWVDEVAMVRKAHDMNLKALPPMVQLRVVEEDKVINGLDFFETAGGEMLANTPGCIARVHRSKAPKRRLVVSADGSFDVNKSKLTYTWVILRGDPDKIKIVPKKEDQSIAEITVAYHERRPIAPGSPMESNRVDIGVFVHNGTYYSAPAFITFCTLDREARTYGEDGRILEIGHGMGETENRVTDWEKVFLALGKAENAKLFHLSDKLIAGLKVLADLQAAHTKKLTDLGPVLRDAEAEAKNAKDPAAREKATKLADAARNKIMDLFRERDAFVAQKRAEILGDSPRHFVASSLAKLTRDPLFTQTHAEWLKKHRTPANEARFKSHWKRLADFGIANDKEVLTPLFPGKTLADAKWTAFERACLDYFNSSLLVELAFPGIIEVMWHENHVDYRLSRPREWRDVYRYDGKGEFIGWTRYSPAGLQNFNHEGLLVVEKDAQMRCVKGQPVNYVQDSWKKGGINFNGLRAVPAGAIVRYEFAGADDLRGRRAGTDKK
jgi:hypothetical protein